MTTSPAVPAVHGPRTAGQVPAPRRGDLPSTGRRREDSRTEGVRRRALATPSSAAAAPEAFDVSWEAALAELELEVSVAEELLERLHRQAELPPPSPRAPWTPPAGLGPLPLPLADRARALADRQTRAAEALTRAVVLNRRQARAVDVLADARDRPRTGDDAVYLDTAL